MTRAILAALLGHWRRNPLQLITLIAGLALGTALWSGVQAINAEARASYAAAASALGKADFAQITPRGGGAIAQDDYIALRRAGWLVSPVIEGDVQGVTLIGMDPMTAPRGFGPQMLGADLRAGADLTMFIAGNGQIFAGLDALDALAGAADLSSTDRILAADMAPNTAITDMGTAQRILAREGQIDRLILAPDQPLGRAPLADIAPHLMQSAPQGGTDVARLTDSFHLNLTAFGLLSFAVGLFIVHGAIGLAFEQRRVMVRSLRACGAPLAWVIGLMLAELMALALLAGGMASDPAVEAKAAAIRAVTARACLFELADRDAEVEALWRAVIADPEDRAAARSFEALASDNVALAGRVMIERTDLVIAVWDGKVANLPGGTGHTVVTALQMGTPVLLIDPAVPEAWRILTRPEELAQPDCDGAPDCARLEAIIRAAVVVEDWSPATLTKEQWRPRSSRAFGLYRRVERMFGGGGSPFASLKTTYEAPGAIAAGSGAGVMAAAQTIPGGDAQVTRQLAEDVLPLFAWADGIASRLADAYRSGMTVN
ncbi:MAG: hypothetical protein ACK4SS_01210, partial [Cypionkella sp.]